MPYQTSSLKYNEKITFYTPQSDKFLGYSQFPNPRCIPYYNDRNSTHKNVSLKDRSIIEKSYSPQNQLNSSLFKYKHNDDLGVSFLTATLLDKKKLMASGKITYLKERQMNEKMVNSLPNIAKIINNQKLHYPNENLFSTQMIKVKKSENSVHEKKLKEQKDIKLKAQFDLKINTERFTKKSQSLGHKTIIFSSNDLNHERKINDFYKTEATRFLDVGTMSKKMEGFNTKTFDGSMKLNFDLETMPLTENMKFESICIKTEKMMDRKIKRQREELEGFKVFIFF